MPEAIRTRGDAADLENLTKPNGELRRDVEAKELFPRAAEAADPQVATRALEYSGKALTKSKSKEFSVTMLDNLALHYREDKDDPSAGTVFRQALALDADSVGVLSNFGSLSQSSGRLPEAERLERLAFAVSQMRNGPRNVEFATLPTNLGEPFGSRGERAEPLTHFRRALAVDQAIYGPNHPELFIDLIDLGLPWEESGVSSDAQTLPRRAVAVAEQHYGAQSQEARLARESLAGRTP